MKTTRVAFIGTVLATLGLVQLAAPPEAHAQVQAGFFSDLQTVISGETVTFFDYSAGIISQRDWSWGDGNTDTFTTDTQVTHIYIPVIPLPATYDVMLTVTEASTGTTSAITKPAYITVKAVPFARFTANTFVGAPALTVNFTDRSEPDGVSGPVASRVWDWDDGTAPGTTATPSHTFDEAGFYNVTLTVTFQNGPTVSETRLVTVLGEGGDTEQPPSSTFTFADILRSGTALLPLTALAQLCHWNLVWDDESAAATRVIETIQFNIKNDPEGGRGADFTGTLHPHDIFQYAILRDQGENDPGHMGLDSGDYVIQTEAEFLWQRDPFPAPPITIQEGTRLQFDRDGWLVDNDNNPSTNPPVNINDAFGAILSPGSSIPYDIFVQPWGMVTSIPASNYILAVRTSAQWHNALTIAYDLSSFTYLDLMVTPPGPPPTDDEGAGIDTIDPDVWPIDPRSAYLASLAVWDTSVPDYVREPEDVNAWTWPHRLHTPLAEHRRPRWDVPGQVFDFVSGEWVELRKMSPVDQWLDVIGINMHGTGDSRLVEVNVVLTDENGTPFDIQFDPRTGLETLTTHGWYVNSNANLAAGNDFSFNGVWTWFDTNGNGLFDPPVPSGSSGITMSDHPLYPDMRYYGGEPGQSNLGLPQWEYIPFPPGGGPPWWKIKLFHDGGRRRNANDTVTGYIEGSPEVPPAGVEWRSSEYCDFFVVVRPDSGFDDVSQLSGDGTGIRQGTTFRAFIEPRRFNAQTGFEDGGIYASSQLPSRTWYDGSTGDVVSAWQDDFRWDEFNAQEPWWPERTQNLNAVKPVRVGGVDIHDLVLTYETNNLYARHTEIWYGDSYIYSGGIGTGSPRTLGTNLLYPYITWWGMWLDPFSFDASRFYDFMTVSTQRYGRRVNTLGVDEDNMTLDVHYPYESVAFYNEEFDAPSHFGPRSPFFPVPPTQPEMPTFATWPPVAAQGVYPRETDWPAANRRARYLKQHIEPMSRPTALLGFNFAAADDPVVNASNRLWLHEVTMAFWGPGLDPTDFLALDEDGTSNNSGVLLVEDTSNDGVFGIELRQNSGGLLALEALDSDSPVPLNDLAWKVFPEYVDVTGDGVADDMNGDGIVNDKDRAWLLRMKLRDAWPVPVIDMAGGGNTGYNEGKGGAKSAQSEADGPERDLRATPEASALEQTRPDPSDPTGYWAKKPQRAVASGLDALKAATRAKAATKAVGPSGSLGDDLFLVVRTSKTLTRFEQFRAFVPVFTNARLPGAQPGGEQPAGFNFTPQVPISNNIYKKFHPEEGPVQEFYGQKPYGMDMIEANAFCEISDLLTTGQTIFQDSGAVPVLGVDLSTNRGNNIGKADEGLSGFGALATFSVPGRSWAAGVFVGCFLIDSAYEAYEIIGNDASTLTLMSGTPRSGAWYIAQEPTFLEQLIVELYDNDRDGHFDLLEDLLPLSINQTVSGLAVYRDNDFSAANRNGLFDAGIDIPLQLDYPPFQIGQVGEPDNQVMFILSTPGTDDIPIPRANQTRHRQVIPETLGEELGDPEQGPDFFIVIRTSMIADIDDDFRVAVVSCGPNTPTEPDPDTFPPPPTSRVGEFDIFSEYPWGYRAIGLITVFRSAPDGSPLSAPYASPPTGYYARGYPEPDNSGFNWVRSTVNKATQTSTITITDRIPSFDDVTITSVSPLLLERTTPAGGVALVIRGKGFGTAPTVVLDGFPLTVNSASDTLIAAVLAGGTVLDADFDGVVILVATNSSNDKSGQFSGLSITDVNPTLAPRVTGVLPDRGGREDFPVAVLGSNFGDPALLGSPGDTAMDVYFGITKMPIQAWTRTRIDVSFPVGGMPATGPLDVTVTNKDTNLTGVLADAFTYVNPPSGGRDIPTALLEPPCFIATAAYGTPFAKRLDTFRAFRDGVLLKTAAGTALVDAYYTVSPALADRLAVHPRLAGCVRAILTPVAWVLMWPGWAATIAAGMMAAALFRRRLAVGPCANGRERSSIS